MTKVSFPLLTGETAGLPDDGTCLVCMNRLGATTYMIYGGCVLMDRIEDVGGPADNMDAYLHFGWDFDGDRKAGPASLYLPVVEDVRGGQWTVYFCSTACMREFLAGCVDELERRVGAECGPGAE